MVNIDLEINSNEFREMIDIVSTVVEEATIDFKKTGIKIRAMDEAQVGMVEVILYDEYFDEYEVEETSIGVKLSKISDFLSNIGSNKVVKLEADSSNIRLEHGGLVKNISTIETTNLNDANIPDLDLSNAFELDIDKFNTGVRASRNISDQFDLKVDYDNEEVKVETENQQDDVTFTLEEEDCNIMNLSKHSESTYALEYFSDFVSRIDNGVNVRFECDHDYPVLLEYNFGEGNGHTTIMLAPRISAEEEGEEDDG